MTYSTTNHAALLKPNTQNTGAPSPEVQNNNKFVPRGLKFKPIALSEIKKVALVLDF